MNLGDIFIWIFVSSAMASIMAILILIMKSALKNILHPSWQYLLWFLLILKLAVPFGPECSASIYNLGNEAGKIIGLKSFDFSDIKLISSEIAILSISGLKKQTGNDIRQAESAGINPPVFSKINPAAALSFIWLTGVILSAFYTIIINILNCRRLRNGLYAVTCIEVTDIWNNCAKNFNIRRNIGIYYSEAVKIPCLYGIFNVKMLIPEGLERIFDKNEIRYIFMHELYHYKKCDILINWLINIIQILHWFNPLICAEAVCDGLVLSKIAPAERRNYGLLIIKMLERKPGSLFPDPSFASIVAGPDQVKWRLKRILSFQNYGLIMKITSSALFAVFCFITLTGALSPDPVSEIGGYFKPGSSRNLTKEYLMEFAGVAGYNKGALKVAGLVIQHIDEKKTLQVLWMAEIAALADHEVPVLPELIIKSLTYKGDIMDLVSLVSMAVNKNTSNTEIRKRIDRLDNII